MKNTKRRNSLLAGSIITLIIITTPYIMYFHNSVPETKTWDTLIGNLDSGLYPSAQIYVYFILTKIVPLLLLFIWFITNKHWWVHALIIPIAVYFFQLVAVVNDAEQYVDKVEFIYTVPITIIIVVILYFIRSKLAIFITAVDLKKEMDEKMKFRKKIE